MYFYSCVLLSKHCSRSLEVKKNKIKFCSIWLLNEVVHVTINLEVKLIVEIFKFELQSLQETTGFAPFLLRFKKVPRLPVDIMSQLGLLDEQVVDYYVLLCTVSGLDWQNCSNFSHKAAAEADYA